MIEILGGGQMANVYCSIDNCHYWSQGNTCKASEIMIAADSWAEQADASMDASQHMDVPTASAETCMDTCCKTFVAKNSSETDVDGVTHT